jgi:hypothetical protein
VRDAPPRAAAGARALAVVLAVSSPAHARVEPAPAPATTTTTTTTHDAQLARALVDPSARLLAGLPVDAQSPLQALSTTPALQKHARAVDVVWQKATAPRLAAQRAFAAQELADVADDAVFYPFGGPDILNALVLFPDAPTYTLLGLEPVGPLPSPALAADGPTLLALQRSLSYVLRHNLFITDAMETQVKGKVGVAALLSFFAVRAGFSIVDARPVTIRDDGSVVDDDGDATRVRGVELVVRRDDRAQLQRVRYFSGNVNDEFFSRTPGLVPHLLSQGPFTTFLKAASYLLYYPAFDDIRAVLLARSAAIVTDTSGLPFHHVDKPPWQLSLYGTYKKPIREFADRCQPDLKNALEQRARGPLPFLYGYAYPGHNHVVVARRAADRGVDQPVFDGTKYKGENTLCVSDRVRVVQVTP